MNNQIVIGESQGYQPQIDEKQNKFGPEDNQKKEENNYNVEQQYPVDIKQDQNISEDIPIINARIRNGFIRKVFSIVAFQLCFTFVFILMCHTKSLKKFISNNEAFCVLLFITSVITLIVCICILSCNRKLARKVPHNYILLLLITFSESILTTTVSLQYSFYIVVESIVLTIAASLGIIIYSLRAKNNINGVRMAFITLISQLFFFGILNFFIRSQLLNSIYCLIGTCLVGFYLVYDVQLLTGKLGIQYSIDDYIFASMEIYIDIIRLFLEILRILSKMPKNK